MQLDAGCAAFVVGVLNGALIALGGVMGFVKAKSKVSLIMGLLCGAVALALSVLARQAPASDPCWLAGSGAWAFLMAIFFGRKYISTGKVASGQETLLEGTAPARKFFPMGFLALFSLGAGVVDVLDMLAHAS
mmetsp:Transcript_58300/g.125258  ORF Transcript_58300/g.125258 Transcript_58300/m.125258 type:complete len:133 (-) Transcript_58300:83-481(-)